VSADVHLQAARLCAQSLWLDSSMDVKFDQCAEQLDAMLVALLGPQLDVTRHADGGFLRCLSLMDLRSVSRVLLVAYDRLHVCCVCPSSHPHTQIADVGSVGAVRGISRLWSGLVLAGPVPGPLHGILHTAGTVCSTSCRECRCIASTSPNCAPTAITIATIHHRRPLHGIKHTTGTVCSMC
jgi:hypothetical protein